MIDYDALAKQAGAISSVPAPSQPSATAPAQPSSGDVDYAALAKQNGATSSTAPATLPGFISTLGSDIANIGKGLVSLPGKIYDYETAPQDPAAEKAQQDAEEAHKTAVYKQFSDNMHAGNYSKAFSGLADLFDPSYDDQNDPLAQAMTAQWNSSAQAKDAMVAAAKKGDTLGVIQHAAGVLPVASQVDAAMTNYQKDPTRENLAHVVSAAIPAFVPAITKGVGAAGSAISDAAGDAVDATLRPQIQNIADTNIPVRAQGTIAKAAETIANPADLKEFEVNQTQPAVRQAVGNIAADAADTEAPTTVPAKADAFGFGQSADEVGARTSAGFQKVDEWSQGKFSDAQDEADSARGSLDYAGKKAYQGAIDTQNELLDQYGAAHPDEDVQSLKADWKQKIGLDELATRFNRSVGPTPAELTTPGQPDLGYVNPSQFRNAIVDAIQNGEFDKAGFNSEHVQSIEDLGRILEQSKPAAGLNATLGSVAKYLGRRAIGSAIGGVIGGVPGAIVGAVAEHGAEWVAGKVLGGIMTDIPAVRTLTSGLATGASANLVGKTLADRLKTLWTDESGELKIPGTGSRQGRSALNHNVSRLSDDLSGLNPTEEEIKEAAARIESAESGQKVAPGTNRQQLVEKWVARKYANNEPLDSQVLSSKDAISKQPPAQRPPTEDSPTASYTFPESLNRPGAPSTQVSPEPLESVGSSTDDEPEELRDGQRSALGNTLEVQTYAQRVEDLKEQLGNVESNYEGIDDDDLRKGLINNAQIELGADIRVAQNRLAKVAADTLERAQKAFAKAKPSERAYKLKLYNDAKADFERYKQTTIPVKVSSEPESADTDTAEADTATDIPSALTGTTNPSPIADALGAEQPEMPRMATGRDYLDNPASLAGLSKLYNDAGSSLFMVPSAGRQLGEKLVPIDQNGQFGATSTGDAGRADNGNMHATATIPTDSQAIIHTHPAGQDPMPSSTDYETATKIGKPNFVMTKDAIYVAMPNGDVQHPVKVADISPGKHGQLNIKWNQ